MIDNIVIIWVNFKGFQREDSMSYDRLIKEQLSFLFAFVNGFSAVDVVQKNINMFKFDIGRSVKNRLPVKYEQPVQFERRFAANEPAMVVVLSYTGIL